MNQLWVVTNLATRRLPAQNQTAPQRHQKQFWFCSCLTASEDRSPGGQMCCWTDLSSDPQRSEVRGHICMIFMQTLQRLMLSGLFPGRIQLLGLLQIQIESDLSCWFHRECCHLLAVRETAGSKVFSFKLGSVLEFLSLSWSFGSD